MNEKLTEDLRKEKELWQELIQLRIQLAEARKILEYVASCDLQIMENGYEAEEKASDYLSKYPQEK